MRTNGGLDMIKVGTTLKDGTIYAGPIKDQHLIMANRNERLGRTDKKSLESFEKENDSGMRLPSIEELEAIEANYEVLKNHGLITDSYVSSLKDKDGNFWLLGIGDCGIQTFSFSVRLVKTVTQEELEALS